MIGTRVHYVTERKCIHGRKKKKKNLCVKSQSLITGSESVATEYKIRFDIEPVQQQRPRFARRGGFVRTYDPKKTADFKKQLHLMATKQFDEEPLTGALRVEIKFFRQIQKSLSKKEHVRRAQNEHRPVVKPDVDNYIKSSLDALTGVIWADDNEIVDLVAGKYYSETPHIELKITKLEEVE